MNAVSFWFLLLMVLVGGFVAWYGDSLGSKLGKKRLTLFKMRPRKFAALMTFLFGALGTLLTILILYATSEPIRTWITEGNAAKARLAQTTKDLRATEEKFNDAEGRLNKLEPELKSKTDEINDKNQKLEDAKIEQLNLNSKNKELDRKGKDLLKKVSSLTRQFQSVNNQLKETNKLKNDLDKKIKAAQIEQGKLTGNNVAIQNQNLLLEQQSYELEKKASKLQGEYATLEDEYNKLLQASKDADAKFNSQLEGYQTDLRNAQEDLRTTVQQLERNRAAVEAFNQSESILRIKLRNSRSGSLLYPAGTEITRLVVPARSNLTEAKAAVAQFIKQTEQAAKAKGAEQTFEGSYAGLIDDERNHQRYTVDQQLDDLARGLVGLPNPKVLLAYSKYNGFEGEFIPIEIKVPDNLLAYEQGDVIFTMQVDGRKSVPDIVESIIDQVDNNLAGALLDKHMIPAIGSDQPFGELSTETIVEIALEIKESGIPLRLQLLATKDTFSADKIVFAHRLRP